MSRSDCEIASTGLMNLGEPMMPSFISPPNPGTLTSKTLCNLTTRATTLKTNSPDNTKIPKRESGLKVARVFFIFCMNSIVIYSPLRVLTLLAEVCICKKDFS